jgi:hypothetical protein
VQQQRRGTNAYERTADRVYHYVHDAQRQTSLFKFSLHDYVKEREPKLSWSVYMHQVYARWVFLERSRRWSACRVWVTTFTISHVAQQRVQVGETCW